MEALTKLFNKTMFWLKVYCGYGYVMSVFIQCILLMITEVVVGFPLYVISRSAYQWTFQRVTEVYMMYFPIMFYYLMGNRVVETGDEVVPNENGLFVLNHSHFYDFLPIVLTAPRCGRIGALRFFMKDEIRKIPIVGFGFYLMDTIYLKRNFEEDKPYILETFKRLRNKYYPFWLTIFPEGTRVKPDKLIESNKYCKENGLPQFKNLLHPRPTGVIVALQQLRKVIPYFYDLTLGYPSKPTAALCFFPGGGMNIHMDVHRIDMKDVPEDDEGLKKWLNDLWIRKDGLVDYFNEHKHFPGKERTIPLGFTWADFTGYMTPECFTKP
ncbi:1-acylglycerol-3-phosphate acyltransferase, putative [Entamoeba invadens IP1]|uniref:1-acylglycerol-3-phosphate acyltransferase, putative n=1 Tax=Entamoeba invadens IP1 TaxID=370355 RepID=UPI0002C3E389|nr:1-acylglycerol-3-phosphate acyltransferase, putative [Entamoeba invadens IP1]ELP93435.1 1-acylglycerol-3-phosphate acyltransferase, putative [Entamoeba invadens IP1]|eukprot:XP_004260206.1 1-acylglycerol-3-phosphate acyltransferase, putative [Entamoeba invadens IP1]